MSEGRPKYLVVLAVTVAAMLRGTVTAPVKTYDQRQDGDLNIQAHLDKIVLLIIPSKNVNFLDYTIKGQFDNLEDISSLLGKEQPLNEVKFKQTIEDIKNNKDIDAIKEHAIAVSMPEKIRDPSSIRDKIDPKPMPVSLKMDSKQELIKVDRKHTDNPTPKESSPPIPNKRTEPDTKINPSDAAKKPTSKLEGRTYQVVHSNSSGDKIVAISQGGQESILPVKEEKSSQSDIRGKLNE